MVVVSSQCREAVVSSRGSHAQTKLSSARASIDAKKSSVPTEDRAASKQLSQTTQDRLQPRRFTAAEIAASRVEVSGRVGWNQWINGLYKEVGSLNGCPLFQCDLLFLKCNDAGEWMISRYADGRPCGSAFHRARGLARPPRSGWCVSSESGAWLVDERVVVVFSGELEGPSKAHYATRRERDTILGTNGKSQRDSFVMMGRTSRCVHQSEGR